MGDLDMATPSTPIKATPSTAVRALLTATVVLITAALVYWKYWDYKLNPWTRHGQVMAQVIQVTPRVSGTIVELPVTANQFVEAGDLLFRIDPRTFLSTLDETEAILDKVKDEIETLKREVDAKTAAIYRYDAQIEQYRSQIDAFQATTVDTLATFRRMERAVTTGAVSQDMFDESKAQYDYSAARLQHAKDLFVEAQASKLQAEAELERAKADLGAEGDQNARLRAAKALVHHAKLDVEFTEVRALVDGYITNLRLRLGDHATANQALMALIDVNTYWVYAFFKETNLERIRMGDRAIVTLMAHPDTPLEGRVVGRGWGTAQKQGQRDELLLPKISDSYQWIRLDRRIPVRVEIETLPEGIEFVVGTRASVMVMTGTSDGYEPMTTASAPAAPQAQR